MSLFAKLFRSSRRASLTETRRHEATEIDASCPRGRLPPVRRGKSPSISNQPSLEAVRRAAELYAQVRQSTAPADLVIARDFKARPPKHTSTRGEAAALAYIALRRGLYLDELMDLADRSRQLPPMEPGPQAIAFALLDAQRWKRPETLDVIATAYRMRRAEVNALAEFFDAKRGLPNYRTKAGLWLAKRLGFPEWVVNRVRVRFPKEVSAAVTALNDEPPLAARVNTALGTRESVAAALSAEHISSEPGALSPDALILARDHDVFATEAFRAGLFEIQDEGSQLIGHIVAPHSGHRVLDLCAGAGGKTLHLGALMKGKGEVIAYDSDPRKLTRARKRVRRSGLQNIRLVESEDAFRDVVARLGGKFDRVLVDAPCSGLGTVRRSPDITLRITEEAIERLAVIQADLLEQAAGLVAPGGRVVYATCSILDDENGAPVRAFLKRHPEFKVVPAAKAFPAGPEYDAARTAAGDSKYFELWPHRHGTDGFYAAVLEKVLAPEVSPESATEG